MSALKYLLNEKFLASLCEKLSNEKVVYGTIKIEDLGASKHSTIELWTEIKEDE